MLGVALFSGIWYAIAGWRPGYSTHEIWMFPLFSALPIGLIMGDVPGAMVIGCAISIMYGGMVAPGSEMPADMSLAGLIGIPIALSIGADTGTAIAIAVPFGVLGVFLNQIRRIINAKFAHMADKCALKGDTKGIANCAMWYPLIMNLVTKFPFAFIGVYFGSTVIEKLLEVLPDWILNGLSVAGGVMPAIGFAVLIGILSERKSIFPFFFLGFFLVQFFGVSSIAAACFGVPIAVIIVLIQKDSQEEIMVQVKAASSVDDDDDDE